MEEYFIGSDPNESLQITTDGRYFKNVLKKHQNAYGFESAKQIESYATEMYFRSRNLLKNKDVVNNNLLVIGKVQSGKTANLEAYTALCFDNGVRLVVIFAGIDNTLTNQTVERFKKTFEVDDNTYNKKYVPEILIANSKEGITDYDNFMINRLIKLEKPIIVVSRKVGSRDRNDGINLVNEFCNKINLESSEVLIIDDEGDQASLNTETKNNHKGKNDVELNSSTYEQIRILKEKFSNPMYLSVTASPHANVFLDNYSCLAPDDLMLLYPSKGYNGGYDFHTDFGKIITIESDIHFATNKIMPKSLKKSIYYYFIASTIMTTREIYESEMVIHSSHLTDVQSEISDVVNKELEVLKELIESHKYLGETSLNRTKKYVNEIIESEFSDIELGFDDFESFFEALMDVVLGTYVVLKNSSNEGKNTQTLLDRKPYIIFVGANLLQRGVTFNNLVVTYFTRNVEGSNIDTTLQRARWFGYRNKYIDLCRIFTQEHIADNLMKLMSSEEDLWEQLEEISQGDKNLAEIAIDVEDLNINPTRGNVVIYDKLKMQTKWYSENRYFTTLSIIEKNNKIIDEFFKDNSSKCTETTIGSKSGSKINHYYKVSAEEFLELVNKLNFVLKDIIDERMIRVMIEKIEIEEFYIIHLNPTGKIRERTVRDNADGGSQVVVLQQGRDKSELSEVDYLGDKKVIINSNAINLQITKIRRKGIGNDSQDQYMFSIYYPQERTGFVRGEYNG